MVWWWKQCHDLKDFRGPPKSWSHNRIVFRSFQGHKISSVFFPTLFRRTRHCYLYNTGDKKTILDVANGKAVCRVSQIFSTNFFYKNTNPATLFKTQFSILCQQNINLFHALCILSQIDLKWATINTNHETLQ